MALFGRLRDIDVFKTVTRELVEDIISQQIGYYKVKLDETKVNVYGEGVNKYYITAAAELLRLSRITRRFTRKIDVSADV